MKAIILLLAIWPFSPKKPVAPPTPREKFLQGRAAAIKEYCAVGEEGWFIFYGPDNMMGLSQVSCEEAFDEWNGFHQVPVPMSIA